MTLWNFLQTFLLKCIFHLSCSLGCTDKNTNDHHMRPLCRFSGAHGVTYTIKWKNWRINGIYLLAACKIQQNRQGWSDDESTYGWLFGRGERGAKDGVATKSYEFSFFFFWHTDFIYDFSWFVKSWTSMKKNLCCWWRSQKEIEQVWFFFQFFVKS